MRVQYQVRKSQDQVASGTQLGLLYPRYTTRITLSIIRQSNILPKDDYTHQGTL